MSEKKYGRLFLKIFIVLIILALFARVAVLMGGEEEAGYEPNSVVAVKLSGVIYDVDPLLKVLEKLEKDKNVVGVVLRINSPGGVITPTQDLYNHIMAMKKPVYSAMETIAASGGYYTAAATKKIYAMPSTITGSVGVIMSLSNVEKLMDKIGIEDVVIKSGKYKDIGNSNRPMTEEERAILQSTVMDLYEQFIEDILKNRKQMDEKVLRANADGRIFTGRQALKIGFVDKLGSYRTAFEDMKKDLKNKELKLKNYEFKKKFWDEIMSVSERFFGTRSGGVNFYYLYSPKF